MSTSCKDPKLFIDRCKKHVDEVSSVGSWEDSRFDSASDAMLNLFDIVRMHEVNLPGHICGVIVTACILESWGSKLDPDYDIMKTIENVVKKQK